MQDHIEAPQQAAHHAAGQYLAVARAALAEGLIQSENVDAMAAAAMLDDVAAARDSLAKGCASGPAAERALSAIERLFSSGDVVELRALDPEGGGAVSYNGRLSKDDERRALVSFIQEWNGRRNLYFGANPRVPEMAGTARAAKAVDIAGRRSVFLDLDRGSGPPEDRDWANTVAALHRLGPTAVFETGGGFHVWFAVASGPRGSDDPSARIASALKHIGSDNVSDLPRIARLPWTVNLPSLSKRRRGRTATLAKPEWMASNRPDVAPDAATLADRISGVARELGYVSTIQDELPWTEGPEHASPHPAPSAEALTAAVATLPNDAGHFDSRDDWQRIGHAIKGASIASGCESEGEAAWLDFSSRWTGGPTDLDHAKRFWDTCRHPKVGWGTLMQTLDRIDTIGAQRVRGIIAASEFEAVTLESAEYSDLFRPWKEIDLSAIPYPESIYRDTYFRGYLTVTTAPPKVGKSMLCLAEAVQMATGRDFLTGEPCPRSKVVYFNLEDDQDMLNSRVAALLEAYGIGQGEIVDRLFVCSGVDRDFHLLNADETANEKAFSILESLVAAEAPDALIFDPLQDLSHATETNEAFRSLGRRLRSFAQIHDVALGVVHHTRKGTPGADVSMDDMRGGSALRGAARINRLLARMSEKEGIKANVDHRNFFRIADAESNLAPPSAAGVRWFQKAGVRIPSGRSVGAVKPWQWPDYAAGFSVEDAAKVRAAIQRRDTPPRAHQNAADWIGHIVANECGLNMDEDREKVRAALVEWERRGFIEKVEIRDAKKARAAPGFACGPVDPLANADTFPE